MQLNAHLGFRQVQTALPYFHALGITHLYLSPVFRARPGSAHGYDVTDHASFNPEVGTRKEFENLSTAACKCGMGLILDIVPNHMAVLTGDNAWWLDLLENGPSATSADRFDIDWQPARASMRNRLLVPVLAHMYGEVLERGELAIVFEAAFGTFAIRYADQVFPLDPQQYPLIFAKRAAVLRERFDTNDPDRQDFENILEGFAALPTPGETSAAARERRYRDKEVNKRRLARLCARRPAILLYIEEVLRAINGRPGNSATFDELEEVLDAQPYRLAFWRVSGEEINYRRFFDVDQLAALRTEDQTVFSETHQLLSSVAESGLIAGVRVDHCDGLQDPEQYFLRLQQLLKPVSAIAAPFIVAEKILATGEQLPDEWAVEGTTGYEFAALITNWLIRSEGIPPLDRLYRRFTHDRQTFEECAYASRQLVMRTSLAAEITMLAIQLDRIAHADRRTADFTYFALREAVVEVIACFPVYRTYISARGVRAEDRKAVLRAVGTALGRRQADSTAVLLLQKALLGEIESQRAAVQQAALAFVMRFQQITGPVMAKGVEDTAFYRYPRLVAINDVGHDPRNPGIETDAFHQANSARAQFWPCSLLTSSTHDSKRGEDARYRLCVLSELHAAWQTHFTRWRKLKSRPAEAGGPALKDEYLLLQTLLGIWPVDAAMTRQLNESLRSRLREYAVKAAREAKETTSWLDPNPEYETNLQNFVDLLLPDSGNAGFADYFGAFARSVAYFGMLNGLAATVIKLTAPGVPDLYQGAELPILQLVDPDNRQPVDFDSIARLLAALESELHTTSVPAFVDRLLSSWRDGRIKLFLTWRLLQLRRQCAQLFANGSYVPLPVTGTHAPHVCAYARIEKGNEAGSIAIVAVARWTATLMAGSCEAPIGSAVWGDTAIEFPDTTTPASRWLDAVSGSVLVRNGERQVLASDLFRHLPVAVLTPRVVPGTDLRTRA